MAAPNKSQQVIQISDSQKQKLTVRPLHAISTYLKKSSNADNALASHTLIYNA